MHVDESPAAELWRRTLSQIPSLFGRLVYLASLRDPVTGAYRHFGFSQRFTPREADKTMKRSHMNIFSDWLCFSLEEQKEDLDRYLDEIEADRNDVLANWTAFPPFTGFIPTQARDPQRQQFLSDMNVMLDLLRREVRSGPFGQPSSGASPHQ